MLLYWVCLLYCLEKSGETWPSLLVVGVFYCACFVWVSSTGCFLVLTFYILSRLRLSGPKSTWGNSEWKFLLAWFYFGSPFRRGSLQNRPPTACIARWSDVTAPWNPGCNGVWPAPKWWQSYYWRIRTSSSRVAAILLWGGWLYFWG